MKGCWGPHPIIHEEIIANIFVEESKQTFQECRSMRTEGLDANWHRDEITVKQIINNVDKFPIPSVIIPIK